MNVSDHTRVVRASRLKLCGSWLRILYFKRAFTQTHQQEEGSERAYNKRHKARSTGQRVGGELQRNNQSWVKLSSWCETHGNGAQDHANAHTQEEHTHTKQTHIPSSHLRTVV